MTAKAAAATVAGVLLATFVAGADAQPATWTMDPAQSALRFTASFEGTPAPGVFRKFETTLRLDPDRPAGSLDVVVSIPSADMGNDDMNTAIRGADWFDAQRFPVAEFHATDLRRSAPDRYVATGTLTVKGVAKPIDVPFAWKPSGDSATMVGALTIDRAAFGIGSGEWRSTKQVAGEVKVDFSVRLRKGG